MRLHPILTLLSLCIAPLAFGVDANIKPLDSSFASSVVMGNDQTSQQLPMVNCQGSDESPQYRRALSMTDAEAEAQCASEVGSGKDTCRGVIQFMRNSAQESAIAKAQRCEGILKYPGSLGRNDQTASLTNSSELAQRARDGNLAEAKEHEKRIEKFKDAKDQMLRGRDSLISERAHLAKLDTDTKLHESVAASPSQPESKYQNQPANPAAQATYEEYRISKPLPGPQYTLPAQSVINASETGSRNLAEHEMKLPRLIEQRERMLKMMEGFEQETKEKKASLETSALQLGQHASALLLQAAQLGAARDVPDMFAAKASAAKDSSEKINPGQKEKPLAKGAMAPSQIDSEMGAKTSLAASAANLTAHPEGGEEAGLLGSFQTTIMDDGKGKLSRPERSRLKDLLRRQGGARGLASGSFSGELISEVLEEIKAEDRKLAAVESKPNSRRGIMRLDVQGAMAEIEAQLEEIEQSMGILNSDSPSLFERVRSVLHRSEKSGVVGKGKS